MTAHISVHIYVHANVAFRDRKNRVKPSLGAQLGANKGHSMELNRREKERRKNHQS